MTSDQELITYNSLGFIPGPDETEDDFRKRLDYCLHLKENLASQSDVEIPAEMQVISNELANDLAAVTTPLFGMAPRWVPVAFSNQQLALWHGGCAWIFQLTEKTPMAAFFQLRSAFLKQKRYLGLYERTELLAHESAHVGRMLFEEPRFEEILAFRTSTSTFRRWFGPIVQSAWESVLFLFALFLCIAIQLFLVSSDVPRETLIGLVAMALPAGLLLLGIVRLWIRHHQFTRCLKKLKQMLNDELKANAVIYRLLDKEISAFGKMSLEEIRLYACSQKAQSLRWRLIYLIYFN